MTEGINIISQKHVIIHLTIRQKPKISCTMFYRHLHKNIMTHFMKNYISTTLLLGELPMISLLLSAS